MGRDDDRRRRVEEEGTQKECLCSSCAKLKGW